jgi:hypothetical protein
VGLSNLYCIFQKLKKIAMLKPTVLVLCSLLITIGAMAQKVNVKVGAPAQFSSDPGEYKFVASGTNFIAMHRNTLFSMFTKLSNMNMKIGLRRYSADMTELQTVELDPEKYSSSFYDPLFGTLDGKPFICLYKYDATQETTTLNMYVIDPTNLTLGSPQELLKWKQESTSLMDFYKESKNRFVTISNSPDNTKMLVFLGVGYINTFDAIVFDNKFQRIWSASSQVVQGKKIDSEFFSACIDNSGRLYSTYRIASKKQYEGHLVIADGKSSLKDQVLSEEMVREVLLKPSSDGKKVHLAGTILNKRQFLSGVYYAYVNVGDEQVAGSKSLTFESDFLRGFDQGHLAHVGNYGGLQEFDVSLFEMENGSINMIGTPSLGWNDKHSAQAGGILSVQFGKDKPIFTCIPRYWNSFFSYGDDVRGLLFGDKLLVVYNDVASNLRQPIGEKAISMDYKNAVLAGALISATGEVERMVLVDRTDDDFMAMDEFSFSQEGVLYVPFWKKKGQGIPGKQTQWARISQ